MRTKGFIPRCFASLALVTLAHFPLSGQTTLTFEELPLPGSDSYWNGDDLSGGFSSQGVRFRNDYSTDWGSWSGFSYSNVNDPATPGYLNQYAVVSGTGLGDGGKYVVGYDVGNADLISLPEATRVLGVYLNNTTYTALVMRDGDAFTERFGGADGADPDWFRLTVTGRDSSEETTGIVDFYLADYRFDNSEQDYIVKDWTLVDLTGLGDQVSKVEFSLASSDVGDFGMNTPAYFVMDNLAVSAVPEPTTLTLWLLGGAVLARKRRHYPSPGRSAPRGGRDCGGQRSEIGGQPW